MLKRILRQTAVALLFGCPAISAWAVEVASIVACKQDGETWLCAALENDSVQVFRSDYYISKVEFRGMAEPEVAPATVIPATTVPATTVPAAAAPGLMTAPPKTNLKPGMAVTDTLPAAVYTLQLLACNAQGCRQQMQVLNQIPGSQIVEIKHQGKLWEVLIVGGYASKKTAQQAAAELIKRYRLRDKPWVRTVDSIRSRLVAG